MKISPSTIGKAAGVVAIVAIIIPLFLWSRSNYTISGKIQIDTGAYVSPARNVDVKLILGTVDDEMKKLIAEYEDYRDFRMEKAIKYLLELGKKSTTNDVKKVKPVQQQLALAVKKADGKIKINLPALTEEERAKVNELIMQYTQNANYCKEDAASCPIGSLFYEKGSLFWESKANNLRENKRLIFDEVTTNYVTTWIDGGLDNSKIQVVKAVVQTNLTIQQLKEALGEITEKKEEPTAPKDNSLLPGYALTTNDVIAVVVNLKRDLQQKYRTLLRKAEDLMIEMTVDQVTTDEDGKFLLKGKSVRPGNFFISSEYDLLSSEGERVEFTWFYPVTISLKRFAFNKSTTVNLDELNQAKPSIKQIYIPDTEEMFLDVIGGLKKTVKQSKEKVNEKVMPSENKEKNVESEINVINIVATNAPAEKPKNK